MYGYIYVTLNKINEKFYIGKHKANKYDPNYYGSGIALKKAIEKYGKENFANGMVDTAETLEELNEKEKYYINFYKAQNRGYNIAPGGDGGEVWGDASNHPSLGKHGLQGKNNPMYGVRHPDEIIERIRKANTGRKQVVKNGIRKNVHPEEIENYLNDGWRCPSLEIKEKKAKIKKDKENGIKQERKKGWHHTEESKKKISEAGIKTKSDPKYKEESSKRAKEVWGRMPDEKREEFRKKCRERQLGKKQTEEANRKRSESLKEGYRTGRIKSQKGRQAWNKGIKVSEEERKRIVELAKGRIHITNGENNKMIYPEEFIEWKKKGYWKGRTIKKGGNNNDKS